MTSSNDQAKNKKYNFLNNFGSKYSLLKVASATFLLVCFVCLKESTCGASKNASYFTSKALAVIETIKSGLLKYSNVMTS